MDEQKPNLDNWNDFCGDFLKIELVKEFPMIVVPVKVEAGFEEGKAKLIIEFELMGRSWKMGLNKTNQDVLRKSGLVSPNAIVGKKLTFDKIKARNPTLNTMVDSFILVKVE
jgi:hypothetical protein